MHQGSEDQEMKKLINLIIASLLMVAVVFVQGCGSSKGLELKDKYTEAELTPYVQESVKIVQSLKMIDPKEKVEIVKCEGIADKKAGVVDINAYLDPGHQFVITVYKDKVALMNVIKINNQFVGPQGQPIGIIEGKYRHMVVPAYKHTRFIDKTDWEKYVGSLKK